MFRGWRIYRTDSLPHVVPDDDLRPHSLDTGGCWCRPTEDDGVVVHHSLDGREDYEERRKPS